MLIFSAVFWLDSFNPNFLLTQLFHTGLLELERKVSFAFLWKTVLLSFNATFLIRNIKRLFIEFKRKISKYLLFFNFMNCPAVCGNICLVSNIGDYLILSRDLFVSHIWSFTLPIFCVFLISDFVNIILCVFLLKYNKHMDIRWKYEHQIGGWTSSKEINIRRTGGQMNIRRTHKHPILGQKMFGATKNWN